MNQQLLLLAAGGHGRVVLDALHAGGFRISGIVDPAFTPGSLVHGVKVLGDDAWLDRQELTGMVLVNGAGATHGSDLRERLFRSCTARGARFLTIRHPSATVSASAVLADGVQLLAGAVVQCDARIGHNCVVNTGAIVEHDCTLHEHVFVGPGTVLCGNVTLGASAFIGAGATILPGVHVGARAVVGAGAVVLHDIEPDARVAGNPARPLPLKGD